VKLYTPTDHYLPEWRKELFPALKPYIGKPDTFTNKECLAQYGFGLKTFTLVPEEEEESALWVLPMSWNYYVNKGKLHLAEDFINKAASQHKKVISFTSGDFGVRIPHFTNLVVFRQSGNASRLPDYHKGMPVFISDPLQKYFQRPNPVVREFTQVPVIGFCGQTNDSVANALKEITRVLYRNLKFYAGAVRDEPQQVLSSSYLRGEVLTAVKRAPGLEANFIERKKYRAGAADEASKKKTTLEFYQNMMEADYIICVRGGGNFSVRFYETLAMGRIPVFVNTDCLLPLAAEIDWKKHVVWVEPNHIRDIEKKITAFHQAHNAASYKALQLSNRKLWQDKLSLPYIMASETQF
jgi:hypothetical protein